MNTIVAGSTNINPQVQLIAGIVFSKVVTPVEFARYQVVKCQIHRPSTEYAKTMLKSLFCHYCSDFKDLFSMSHGSLLIKYLLKRY